MGMSVGLGMETYGEHQFPTPHDVKISGEDCNGVLAILMHITVSHNIGLIVFAMA